MKSYNSYKNFIANLSIDKNSLPLHSHGSSNAFYFTSSDFLFEKKKSPSPLPRSLSLYISMCLDCVYDGTGFFPFFLHTQNTHKQLYYSQLFNITPTGAGLTPLILWMPFTGLLYLRTHAYISIYHSVIFVYMYHN